jgi:hypothetical protein
MSADPALRQIHRRSQGLIEQTRRFFFDLPHRIKDTPHARLAQVIQLAIRHDYILRTPVAFDDTFAFAQSSARVSLASLNTVAKRNEPAPGNGGGGGSGSYPKST